MSEEEPKERRHPILYQGRAWGSFQYTRSGQPYTIRFTKDVGQGYSGTLGYIFGCRSDCDVVLPTSATSDLISVQQFLVYKEIDCGVECVYLRDLSDNGTFVNGTIIGQGKIIRLQHGDTISYLHSRKDDKDVLGRVYKFQNGDQDDDLTFDSQFVLGDPLGRGGFAIVYKTTEKKTDTIYAVKVYKKSTNFNRKMILSLQREIGALMSIDHVFSEETNHYVVIEYAKGGELFDIVKKKGQFTEPEARLVFQQILQGVKYLHDRGIVHRDLKLENILLMDKETLTVKISDFGLSTVTGEQSFLRTVCGTPSYVAPEVLRNEAYGKPVDMWSLGVVLYILLCGFPPFSDDLAPPALRVQVLENLYTFPMPYWDEITDEAMELVEALLHEDTGKRLTVDAALAHIWMQLKDNEGTISQKTSADGQPKVHKMISRIRSHNTSQKSLQSQPSSQSMKTVSMGSFADSVKGSCSASTQAFAKSASPEILSQHDVMASPPTSTPSPVLTQGADNGQSVTTALDSSKNIGGNMENKSDDHDATNHPELPPKPASTAREVITAIDSVLAVCDSFLNPDVADARFKKRRFT
ncbi:hypothetical protein BX616_003954 [Lobosporangium transversale]|nr:hypothetical protein BX616_003954 [Lobosporangium transversale]